MPFNIEGSELRHVVLKRKRDAGLRSVPEGAMAAGLLDGFFSQAMARKRAFGTRT
jgi:hypothetical protein